MSSRYDAAPRFDEELFPLLVKIPYFRFAPEEEINRSYAAYESGDARRLVDEWRASCAPMRATLDGAAALIYRQARRLPRALTRSSFLATVRAVLAAGRHLFARELRPETARQIRARFSFLERRHEHIPDGWTPPFAFPPAFARWIDGASVDEAVARFQLAAALNEVQQHAYSLHFADAFGLPEVRRHAERERTLALAYLAAWSPPSTRALWRQCVLVLDGLNAAVFELACRRPSFPIGTALHALGGGGEWARFVAAMDRPLDLAALPTP
jgi:hypothetical protein